jgi:hypothetical protein
MSAHYRNDSQPPADLALVIATKNTKRHKKGRMQECKKACMHEAAPIIGAILVLWLEWE